MSQQESPRPSSNDGGIMAVANSPKVQELLKQGGLLAVAVVLMFVFREFYGIDPNTVAEINYRLTSIERQLETATDDRFRRSDMRLWLAEFKAHNPDIQIPGIGAINE